MAINLWLLWCLLYHSRVSYSGKAGERETVQNISAGSQGSSVALAQFPDSMQMSSLSFPVVVWDQHMQSEDQVRSVVLFIHNILGEDSALWMEA